MVWPSDVEYFISYFIYHISHDLVLHHCLNIWLARGRQKDAAPPVSRAHRLWHDRGRHAGADNVLNATGHSNRAHLLSASCVRRNARLDFFLHRAAAGEDQRQPIQNSVHYRHPPRPQATVGKVQWRDSTVGQVRRLLGRGRTERFPKLQHDSQQAKDKNKVYCQTDIWKRWGRVFTTAGKYPIRFAVCRKCVRALNTRAIT